MRAVDPLTQESVPLFHPRQQHWQDHFDWSLDGTKVEGTTAIGRATVVALRRNHALIVAARRRWCAVGCHAVCRQLLTAAGIGPVTALRFGSPGRSVGGF